MKWEYLLIKGAQMAVTNPNSLGGREWELVAVVGAAATAEHTLYFKRPVKRSKKK